MYNNKQNNDKLDIFSYIDGSDIYNSGLLKKIKDSEFTKKYYILSNTDKRLDLISKSLYNSPEKESFIAIMNPDFDPDKSEYITFIPDLDTELGELS